MRCNPSGTLLTCAALYNAWRAMRRGDHNQVQRMFRARIGAQAFTVCAIVAGGAYYGKDREKRQELIKLEAQQRAEERHNKWLRELEVRDEEEKQLQDHLRKRKERKAALAAADKTPSAETTPDAEGQVPLEDGKKTAAAGPDGSKVMGALAQTGSWFGLGGQKEEKGEDKKDDKIAEAASKVTAKTAEPKTTPKQ